MGKVKKELNKENGVDCPKGTAFLARNTGKLAINCLSENILSIRWEFWNDSAVSNDNIINFILALFQGTIPISRLFFHFYKQYNQRSRVQEDAKDGN